MIFLFIPSTYSHYSASTFIRIPNLHIHSVTYYNSQISTHYSNQTKLLWLQMAVYSQPI